MHARYRAVGFDLGETLLYYQDVPPDWSSLYKQALHEVAAACGFSPDERSLAAAVEILKQYNTRLAPRTQEVTSDRILTPILAAWRLDSVRCLPAATKSFFGFFRRRVSCYADTVPLLTQLHQQALPVGVLTDVPYGMPPEFVQRDLLACDVAGLCGVVLTSTQVGKRKPDPAGFVALAGRLGVKPGEMLFVGNEPKDILGANQAGAFSVLLARSPNPGHHGQRATISTLAQVPEFLVPDFGP